ncbi:MAG: hypothetical protein KJ970_12505 [Candidatus Eisenbacteria bacterium]|uniref:Uncharacterized protein n=1 Tax=Eiseniibacteriota bacterium TaxID=2212470 RepID=A0A948RY57_UNCEI|nr:hypothetical protein [Candidatus Eisenbacteria bacterium]MBU1950639.1 hypothetical protein [Candidatus Eisenbacteria bacterium]MBU2691739.1 hypothetical protein [Candidatus Eisenbacteria bacterium]
MDKPGPQSPSDRDLSVIHRESDPGIACRIVERLQTRGGLTSISPYPALSHEILVFQKDAGSAEHLIHQFLTDYETGVEPADPASDPPESPPAEA